MRPSSEVTSRRTRSWPENTSESIRAVYVFRQPVCAVEFAMIAFSSFRRCRATPGMGDYSIEDSAYNELSRNYLPGLRVSKPIPAIHYPREGRKSTPIVRQSSVLQLRAWASAVSFERTPPSEGAKPRPLRGRRVPSQPGGNPENTDRGCPRHPTVVTDSASSEFPGQLRFNSLLLAWT